MAPALNASSYRGGAIPFLRLFSISFVPFPFHYNGCFFVHQFGKGGKYKQKFEKAEKSAKIWKDRYEKLDKDHEELKQKVQPFLDAIEIASEKVWAFINAILARGKELYEHKHPARNRGQDMEI